MVRNLFANCLIFIIFLLNVCYISSFYIPFSMNPNDVQFLLYTSVGPRREIQELSHGNILSLTESYFNPELPTVFMIHGFYCDRNTNFPTKVREAYLETIASTQNYIVVDWGRLSQPVTPPFLDNMVYPLVYPLIVKQNIPIVGNRVADFVQFLISHNLTDLSNLHILGHSLGAHISGYVGQLLQNKDSEGRKVARITALDPAGPLFEGISIQRHLKKEDAAFVDVYHTAMGSRGDSTADGHIDFYPNGGMVQPPCPQDAIFNAPASDDLFGKGSCSHEFAVDIYAATIRKDITACKCNPTLEPDDLNDCMKTCPDAVLAGEKCPIGATGQYYFTTGKSP